MSYKFSSLTQKSVDWKDGSPVSSDYGDIYFSREDGIAESSFTFLDGVDLDNLWQDNAHVTIAETGFGTGLNFLLTWQRWRALGSPGNLTFISVEGHPFDEAALAKAHEAFPELAEMTSDLRAKWPPAAAGYHLRLFDGGKVALILMFGDAKKELAQLQASVDAWYLDGFSPAKNSDMWNDAVFKHIARTAKPECKLATFTAAGFVKRGLEAVGFTMEKTAGYGKKRNRLVGTYKGANQSRKWQGVDWSAPPPSNAGSTIVIGVGISGISTAAALKRLGQDVRIIAAPTIDKASDVPVAILSPHLLKEATARARFIANSFCHAISRDDYNDAFLSPRGIEIHTNNDAEIKRHQSLVDYLGWTKDWAEWRGDHLALDRSGTVRSDMLLEAMSKAIKQIEGHVSQLQQAESGWKVILSDGATLEADNIIIAAGLSSQTFDEIAGIPLRSNRGQVCLIDEDKLDQANRKTLSFGGYLSPAFEHMGKVVRLLGSTFARWAFDDAKWKEASNKDYAHITRQYVSGIEGAVAPNETSPDTWIGMRARTYDSLPFVGPVPDWENYIEVCEPLSKDRLRKINGTPPYVKGLYAITGLGSKGFQHGPLAGEVVASMIAGTALPVEAEMMKCLHPAKAAIRSLIRGELT